MFSVGKPGSKRRQHISSPGQEKTRQRHRGIKQHKLVKELEFKESSDISDSEYYSDIDDSQPAIVQHPTLRQKPHPRPPWVIYLKLT